MESNRQRPLEAVTYMAMRLEELGQVRLVGPDRWRRPASSLKLIQAPAMAAILARVLFARNLAVDFNHCIDDILDVLLLRDGHPVDTEWVARYVRSQQSRGASAVEIERWVAYRTNSWNVCAGGARAVDRFLKMLPKARLVLQSNLTGRPVRDCFDSIPQGGGEGWGSCQSFGQAAEGR